MPRPAAAESPWERGFSRSRSGSTEIGAEPGKIQEKQNDADGVVLLFYAETKVSKYFYG